MRRQLREGPAVALDGIQWLKKGQFESRAKKRRLFFGQTRREATKSGEGVGFLAVGVEAPDTCRGDEGTPGADPLFQRGDRRRGQGIADDKQDAVGGQCCGIQVFFDYQIRRHTEKRQRGPEPKAFVVRIKPNLAEIDAPEVAARSITSDTGEIPALRAFAHQRRHVRRHRFGRR